MNKNTWVSLVAFLILGGCSTDRFLGGEEDALWDGLESNPAGAPGTGATSGYSATGARAGTGATAGYPGTGATAGGPYATGGAGGTGSTGSGNLNNCLAQSPGVTAPGALAVSAGPWSSSSDWGRAPWNWGSAGSGPIPDECTALELQTPKSITISADQGSWVGCAGIIDTSLACGPRDSSNRFTLVYSSEQVELFLVVDPSKLTDCSSESVVGAIQSGYVWATFKTTESEKTVLGNAQLTLQTFEVLAVADGRLHVVADVPFNSMGGYVSSKDSRCNGSCWCGTSRLPTVHFDLDLALPLAAGL